MSDLCKHLYYIRVLEYELQSAGLFSIKTYVSPRHKQLHFLTTQILQIWEPNKYSNFPEFNFKPDLATLSLTAASSLNHTNNNNSEYEHCSNYYLPV